MTLEERQMLLADIYARVPYGVNCSGILKQMDGSLKRVFGTFKGWYIGWATIGNNLVDIKTVRPYLRPMSSMTEEEKKELRKLCDEDLSKYAKFILDGHGLSHDGLYMFYPLRQLDFLNSHHFDYRGLIEKGLALEAPAGMYV